VSKKNKLFLQVAQKKKVLVKPADIERGGYSQAVDSAPTPGGDEGIFAAPPVLSQPHAQDPAKNVLINGRDKEAGEEKGAHQPKEPNLEEIGCGVSAAKTRDHAVWAGRGPGEGGDGKGGKERPLARFGSLPDRLACCPSVGLKTRGALNGRGR